MPSEGSLFGYVRELVLAGNNWPEIKPLLQSRFSECGNSILAKHKLYQLKQEEMALHEFNEEYTKLLEHAYSLQPTDSTTITLISSYIQGITNLYVGNKLRTTRVSTLKETFTFALEEDQKQKISALDFETKPEQMNPIEINAVKNSTCYKCGKERHCAKECPQNHQQPFANHTPRYTPQQNSQHTDTHTGSISPIVYTLSTLMDQIKQLSSSTQNTQNHLLTTMQIRV